MDTVREAVLEADAGRIYFEKEMKKKKKKKRKKEKKIYI